MIIAYLFSCYQFQELQRQAQNNTQLISAYLDRYLSDIDNITRSPYYYSYFHSRTRIADLSVIEKNELSTEIGKTFMFASYTREDFGDLLFISDQEAIYFNVEDYYQYLSTTHPLSSRNWYKQAIEKGGKLAIVPSEENTDTPDSITTKNFFISRRLNNLYNPDQENVIMINMKTDVLTSLFSELSKHTPHLVLFTNDKGELIYSNTSVNSALLEQLNEESIHYEHSSWIHCANTLDQYPVNIHVLLSTSYIVQQIYTFILFTIILGVAGVCIAYILFHKSNKWIKIPVMHIQDVLKEMQNGNLSRRCEPLTTAEFNGIGNSVNNMAEQLQQKIKNEYELSIAQKDLQFQALQSQIQPHFIINTIYSFITLNQIGEQELLNDAFYSFAHLLRYVLNKDKNSTIEKELAFLEHYCSLYQLRFGNRITYHIHCEPHLRDHIIPKLLLQPLVENAVIHGIEPSETPCTLSVDVEEHQNTIYIMIEDNGVGFTEEQLLSPSSIGIKNVEARMHIWNEKITLSIYRIQDRSIQILAIPKEVEGGTNENTSN